MTNYLETFSIILQSNANAERAAGAKAYLLHQFEFFGIPVPVLRKLSKQYIKQNPLASMQQVEQRVKEAWQCEQREWQYFAIELLYHYKKQWNASTIKTIEYCITHKSWWDTVDAIAYTWAGEYFKMFSEQIKLITGKWNLSGNIWLQRSSLLFQKKYKHTTDTTLLQQYIQHLAASDEFFIRKAIGWILREYAYTNAEWVKKFVAQNALSSLSKKEALKHLK